MRQEENIFAVFNAITRCFISFTGSPARKQFNMPIIKVYLHFVWATKRRIPFLSTNEIRNRVWFHINENGRKKGLHVLQTSGHKDHCHCLISLSHDQTISKVAMLLKGESSFWINKSEIIKADFPSEKFDWQDEYFVESVSPMHLDNVKHYLDIQEEHHKENSFDIEYKEYFGLNPQHSLH